MGRSAKIVLTGAFIALAIGFLAYFTTVQVCAQHMAGPDELEWLRREFHLSDAEMAKVRQLHEGYLPTCRAMCEKIAAKRSEVESTLASHTDANVPTKLLELATLRAQCQAQMLQHFQEVSRAMPAEEGSHYLAEMQRLTLGFHEQLEDAHSDHVHGNH